MKLKSQSHELLTLVKNSREQNTVLCFCKFLNLFSDRSHSRGCHAKNYVTIFLPLRFALWECFECVRGRLAASVNCVFTAWGWKSKFPEIVYYDPRPESLSSWRMCYKCRGEAEAFISHTPGHPTFWLWVVYYNYYYFYYYTY